MEQVLDLLSWVLLVSGGLIGIIGGVGMLRLPDLFSRMHAAGMIDTLAVALMILGMMLQSGHWLIAVKLAIILIFLFFTSPTSTHALAKAAIHGGHAPWTPTGEASLAHQPSEAPPPEHAADSAEPDPSKTSSA